MTAKAQINLHF